MADYFLVAGGTGGHVFPALALAQSLREAGHSVRMITDKRGLKFIKNQAVDCLSAEGVLGRSIPRCIVALFLLGWGYLQAHWLLLRHRPHTVVGFGGYAALSMVLAAQHQRRRSVLHEQNAVMGRVNRLLARKADLVALSFAKTQHCPQHVQTVHVGNPAAGVPMATSNNAANGQFRLMVLGGSLGAQLFDRLVIEALTLLPENARQKIALIQQTVAIDPEQLCQDYAVLGVQASCAKFIDAAATLMLNQSMIITRAGGGITAEVSNAGLPALYVPLPIAADQHQYHNADYYVQAGGAEILAQSDLTPNLLATKLQYYLDHPAALELMSQAMHNCAMPEALLHLHKHVEHNISEPS